MLAINARELKFLSLYLRQCCSFLWGQIGTPSVNFSLNHIALKSVVFSFIQKFYIKVNFFKWKGMFILTFANNTSFLKVHQRQLLNSKIIMANSCPTSNFLPNVDITHYVYLNTRILIFISLIVLPNDGLIQSSRSDKGILKKANGKEAFIYFQIISYMYWHGKDIFN